MGNGWADFTFEHGQAVTPDSGQSEKPRGFPEGWRSGSDEVAGSAGSGWRVEGCFARRLGAGVEPACSGYDLCGTAATPCERCG